MAEQPQYALAGKREGWTLRPTDEVTHCDDGYTEVRRNGAVVGVYRTDLLTETTNGQR